MASLCDRFHRFRKASTAASVANYCKRLESYCAPLALVDASQLRHLRVLAQTPQNQLTALGGTREDPEPPPQGYAGGVPSCCDHRPIPLLGCRRHVDEPDTKKHYTYFVVVFAQKATLGTGRTIYGHPRDTIHEVSELSQLPASKKEKNLSTSSSPIATDRPPLTRPILLVSVLQISSTDNPSRARYVAGVWCA